MDRSAVLVPVSLIAVAPTSCELAGLEPRPCFDGESLLPLVRGERGPARLVYGESVNLALL